MRRVRRGISPVVSTIIIVVVAIAISIAAAGWFMGLWRGLAAGNPQIYVPYAFVYSNGAVAVHITNQGGGADTLIKAELIAGNTTYTLTLQKVNGQEEVNGQSVSLPLTIEANQEYDLTFSATLGNNKQLPVGQNVEVRLYFEKSPMQSIPAIVQPAQSSG